VTPLAAHLLVQHERIVERIRERSVRDGRPLDPDLAAAARELVALDLDWQQSGQNCPEPGQCALIGRGNDFYPPAEWMTRKEAAGLLEVSPRTVGRLAHDDGLITWRDRDGRSEELLRYDIEMLAVESRPYDRRKQRNRKVQAYAINDWF
jgi:hypothetical protein